MKTPHITATKARSVEWVCRVLILLASFNTLRATEVAYSVTRSINQAADEGSFLFPSPMEGSDGRLYCVATSGGVSNIGSLFAIGKNGSGFQKLKDFSTNSAGLGSSYCPLIEGTNGLLYGGTDGGGASGGGGVFSINKDGSGYSVLHEFSGAPGDGASCDGGLLVASDGKLYGTTSAGGTNDTGVIFTLNHDGSGFAILHNFIGAPADGAYPFASLIEGSDGVLYGVTDVGGSADAGALFKLNKDGSSYSVLRSFGGSPGDGTYLDRPLAEGPDGVLYGTTYSGGTSNRGTIFQINKDGSSYSVLMDFVDPLGVQSPYSALSVTPTGTLVGTSLFGGANGAGTIFQIATNGSNFCILHEFGAFTNDLQIPSGQILGTDEIFYGTAWSGGQYGSGGIFRLRLGSNSPPVAALSVPNQSGFYGTPFSYELPPSTFTDPDGSNTLGFSATGMPPGITFDSALHSLQGLPTAVGSNWVTVTATDDGGLSTNTSFVIVIAKAPLTVAATSTNRPFGEFNPYFELTFTGLVLGEQPWQLAFFAYADCVADQTTTPGVFPIIVHGGVDPHYDVTLSNATLTVTHALLVVEADDFCRKIGATNPPLTGTIWGTRNNDSFSFTLSTTATPASPVGEYPIIPVLIDPTGAASNYVVTLGKGALHVVAFDIDYALLHSFGFTNTMGHSPRGGLTLASDGKLYGTTDGAPAIFRINQDGTGYQRLLTAPDLSGLASGVIEGGDGALYGVAKSGGNNSVGSVFKLNKDGSGYQVLYHFVGGSGNADAPHALIEATNGVLYGLATSFYSGSRTVLFSLNRDGTGFTNLYDFANTEFPAGLFQSSDGRLYGTTQPWSGPPSDLWRMELDGTGYTVLYSIGGGWTRPVMREASDGVFYGTLEYGNKLFRINRDGSGYTVLHNFGGVGDGSYPFGGIIEGPDGALYGNTYDGGTNYVGTLYRINKDGSSYTILRHLDPFAGPRGQFDHLTAGADGQIHGMSFNGNCLFNFATNGNDFSVVWSFSVSGGDGSFPGHAIRGANAMIEGTDGKLYGVAEGGANGLGVVFKMHKDGSDYGIVHHFTPADGGGWVPVAGLLQGIDGALYGSTSIDLTNYAGTLFKVSPDGSGFSVLHIFSGGDGSTPIGALVQGTNGLLYGVTQSGGTNSYGTIFSVQTNGSSFTTLRHLDWADGVYPEALALGSDGLLYITSRYAGTNGQGTLSRMQQDGSGFTVLHAFPTSSLDASEPMAALLESSDGFLYGTSFDGGTHDGGAIYRLHPDGSGYEVVRNLGRTVTDGAAPHGGLVEGGDGVLYGVTWHGGTVNDGVLFRLTKDEWDYCVLHHFGPNGPDGIEPVCTLVRGSDGAVYGTLSEGGANQLGAVFRLALTGNSPPVVAAPISDQTNIYGGALTFTFATNTFADADIGQTLAYTSSNLPPGISFDGPTRTFTGVCSNAGTYLVTVNATDNGSPALSTNNTFNIVVGQVPLLATADDKVRLYGTPNPPLTISYLGFVLGDTEAELDQPPLIGTGAATGSPVGAYPITLSGGADTNYSFVLTNGTLTVTPASLVATAFSTNRLYGQPNPSLAGSLVGLTNDDPVTVAFATAADAASLPGTYDIYPLLNDPSNRLGNYSITTNLALLTVDCPGTFTVTNTADAGPGTLREALVAACPGATINFAVNGVITLTSDELRPLDSLIIVGPGATNLTLSGGNVWRVFDLTNGSVQISGLTIANGDDSAEFLVGAGIRNNAQLVLTECVLSNNTSQVAGGAVFNRPQGVLTVERCLFVNNRALGDFQGGGNGGAIANQGVMFITNSTFSGNSAGYTAGAIRNTGSMVIESCTFTANTVSECTNCVGTPSLVAHLGTNAVIHNSIFGGNTNALGIFRDLTGVMDYGDYNLVEFASGYIGTGTNDLPGVAPLLGLLADNGGPTQSHLPLTGSPAIDAGDPAGLLTLDQRGFARPQNSRSDIGAVEAMAPIVPPTLFIVRASPSTVTVSWSPASPGFVLQTNTSLNPLTWGSTASGSTNPVTLPIQPASVLFRLKH